MERKGFVLAVFMPESSECKGIIRRHGTARCVSGVFQGVKVCGGRRYERHRGGLQGACNNAERCKQMDMFEFNACKCSVVLLDGVC